VTISEHCARGLHGFCRGDHTTCSCGECHFVCARCAQPCRTLNGPDHDICAPCARRDAQASGVARRASQACDHCGAGGAIRDPRTRKNVYLCSGCHAGDLSRLPGVAVDLNAACAGHDVSDPLHAWYQVKGRKHICSRCTMTWYVDSREVAARTGS
jgi:hypothetical protein